MAGISINLAGDFSKLDELKSKAGKAAASIKSAFGSDLGKKMFAGVGVAAAAAFAGVVAAVKSAVDAGGELQDMMARTGAAGKGLVIMQRAFENAGLAASQVPAVLNKMQKALAGVNEEGEPTNEAFAKLGLSIQDLLTLDPVAAFQQIQSAISGIQDPAQRTAIAMELFGKSGGELLAVFQDSGAFSQAEQQVGSLGDTLADNAAALDAVGDAFGALDTKVQQVGAEVAVALLPQLEQLSEWLNATDFSAIGGGIGILAEKAIAFGSALADLAKYMPLMIAMEKIAGLVIGTDADPVKAAEMAAGMADPNYKRSDTATAPRTAQNLGYTDTPATATVPKTEAELNKEADLVQKAAEAAEKKAEAERKSAAEKAKSRAAALEEYNLDSAILSARLKSDAAKLASLEREKKIREEMKRLESAGFTTAEARKPAEAKVDAEAAATKKEDAAKKAEDERQKIQDTLQGKLDSARDQIDGQQFSSTIGSISSMQRIGGGGGAVGSGLDYARQAADLQREANTLMRQLIEVSRNPVEV